MGNHSIYSSIWNASKCLFKMVLQSQWIKTYMKAISTVSENPPETIQNMWKVSVKNCTISKSV